MIYLDNAATTPILKDVLNYSERYFDLYFNPSALYSKGLEVSAEIAEARRVVLSSVGGKGFECVFTSGGSESDNTAIFSSAVRGNAVTSLGEHSAVYESFKCLERKNVNCRYAKLNKDGSMDVEDLLSKIDERTSFVSVVHVNNETGAINDVNEIASLVKRKNPKLIFHSDGVQAFGKIPFKLSSQVDFYSVSAHKIGAFKGVGALLKNEKATLHPLIYGGGQEKGYRSGTENIVGISSLKRAVEIKYSSIQRKFEYVSALKKRMMESLPEDLVIISTENGSPYILTFAVPSVKGEVLQHILESKGVIVGTGSACSSRNPYSRILKECGYDKSVLEGVLRVSFSPENTVEEIDVATKEIAVAINQLKKVIK